MIGAPGKLSHVDEQLFETALIYSGANRQPAGMLRTNVLYWPQAEVHIRLDLMLKLSFQEEDMDQKCEGECEENA